MLFCPDKPVYFAYRFVHGDIIHMDIQKRYSHAGYSIRLFCFLQYDKVSVTISSIPKKGFHPGRLIKRYWNDAVSIVPIMRKYKAQKQCDKADNK